MTSSAPHFDPDARLTLDQAKSRLDEIFYLDVVGRSYEYLLDLLSLLSRPKQEFALHWGKVVARTDVELGYLLIELVPEAMSRLTEEQARRWVVGALDAYDSKGMRAAAARLRDIAGFAQACSSLRLEDVEGRLTSFAQALAARPLRVVAGSAGEGAWTDTASLYLPARIEGAQALERYKALVALLWAQTRHGTFVPDLGASLAAHGDAGRAAAWLAQLEMLRLVPRIGAELPGLQSSMQALLDSLPAAVAPFASRLARIEATVADSLACLPPLMPHAPPASPLAALRPDLASRARAERVAHDAVVLRRVLVSLMAGRDNGDGERIRIDIDKSGEEVRIDGEAVALPPEGRAAAQSLVADLGKIPPEFLVPAGSGEWAPSALDETGPVASLEIRADAVYDEWDYRRRAYRRNWCHLYLRDLPEGDADYVPDVRRRHAALIRKLRRRFEALRGDDRMLRRQAEGAEIDIDAVVDAIADRRGGVFAGDRVFMRRSREERSLAVTFMVDMSGSTKGWVNDAEREALVMLCEALEALGDAYAIRGFSGWTRTRCELYRIKDFGARYDGRAMRRIAAIEAKDYTRMGPPLRHLTRELLRQPARHRLLVTLSDGRPDDFGDEYRGQYGIEDTRQALLEAREIGVRAYCVTIDRHGADYLKRMYGPASYTVLDDVRKLPLRIADIYRRLTT